MYGRTKLVWEGGAKVSDYKDKDHFRTKIAEQHVARILPEWSISQKGRNLRPQYVTYGSVHGLADNDHWKRKAPRQGEPARTSRGGRFDGRNFLSLTNDRV